MLEFPWDGVDSRIEEKGEGLKKNFGPVEERGTWEELVMSRGITACEAG